LIRANVLAQSVVLTRIMDYWGRTGGFSLVLPYALIDTSAGPFRASTNGVSDVGFIFGGPALTRERANGAASMRGADMGLNYERVVAKPAREPYSQTVRLTVRQLW
jgi:hypothetical protein